MESNTINLSQKSGANVTMVSNLFIEQYMPAANGSYVKVFLYLLYCLSLPEHAFSLSFLADRLENTEKDIVRALNYWEKAGVLSLSKGSDNVITGILLRSLKEGPADDAPVSEEAPSPAPPPFCAAQEPAATVSTTAAARPERPIYTSAQIAELTDNEEVKWLLNIIEIYLERPLKPTDIQLVLYLHENLGFSTELIMHLYDYCVSKNKKSPSYVEAVALSWASEGIDTIDKADASIHSYNENYQAIAKAFGINRTPGTIEKQYMDKWLAAYGSSLKIITEACSRSLLNTGKPDFKYADKILENWSKKGVSQFSDIDRLDEAHSSRVAAKAPANAASRPKPAANRFNSFPQRNYSSSDYEALEQRLLQK